jgi:hypothetical protein
MAAIGKNNLLVDLIHQKTKLKKQDIVDIFKVLPECMAETFIQSNLEENQPIDLGGINLRWKLSGPWGANVTACTTKQFKSHLTRLKIERNHPLAERLYNLMHPKNKRIASERCKRDTTTMQTLD